MPDEKEEVVKEKVTKGGTRLKVKAKQKASSVDQPIPLHELNAITKKQVEALAKKDKK